MYRELRQVARNSNEIDVLKESLFNAADLYAVEKERADKLQKLILDLKLFLSFSIQFYRHSGTLGQKDEVEVLMDIEKKMKELEEQK